ncbi:MAG: hypothetical protein DRN14_03675 [Thermoplasmata archaeon]|nr:MAG: hypothetical protein DRN14_03675 [Thermoplasmata archaeon]
MEKMVGEEGMPGNLGLGTDSVLATFVAKYVSKFGLERAIEKLSRINTPQAKKALGLISVMYSEKMQKPQKPQRKITKIEPTITIVRRSKPYNHPKDYFITTCLKMGISPDEAEADSDFKPIITVKWTRKTTFNNKKILIPREILNQKMDMLQYGAILKLRVYTVKDDRIIAEPIKVVKAMDTFKAKVRFVNKRLTCSAMDGKKVVFPKEYLQQLLKELIPLENVTYIYEMQKLNENENGIVAKPLRLLNSEVNFDKTSEQIEMKIKQLKERGRIVLSS